MGRGTSPGVGAFWGVCVAAVIRQNSWFIPLWWWGPGQLGIPSVNAIRYGVGYWGCTRLLVPGLPPAFRARHPHQCLLPLTGGAAHQ